MPLLPLSPGDTDLGGGDLPVRDVSDVLVVFPKLHRRPETAPVRDAFAAGFAEGFKEYQNDAAYCAAQTDPMRCTGNYLKGFASEHSVVPLPGETEDSVRARLFQAPKIVTPDALVAGVDAILQAYDGAAQCTMIEPDLDGWFVHDGTSEWDSFVDTIPDYADRYYSGSPEYTPPGCIPSDGYPRNFLLYVPSLDAIWSSVVEDQIVAYVEEKKGQGMTWALVVVYPD